MQSELTNANLALHESAKAVEAYTTAVGLRADEAWLIREFFPPAPARVLDLGVGNGRTTVPLAQWGYDVVGIEYCRDLVEAANVAHPHVTVVEGDARALQADAEAFDAAFFSWNGIDYMYPLEERLTVLREVLRVLRPGGMFLVSSHNAWGCVGRLFRPPLLTRRAARFWWQQLRALKHVREGYFYWSDPALGMPLFFSAGPAAQQRILRNVGWDVVAVRSAEHPERPARTLLDVHVQYVCRKPQGRR